MVNRKSKVTIAKSRDFNCDLEKKIHYYKITGKHESRTVDHEIDGWMGRTGHINKYY